MNDPTVWMLRSIFFSDMTKFLEKNKSIWFVILTVNRCFDQNFLIKLGSARLGSARLVLMEKARVRLGSTRLDFVR